MSWTCTDQKGKFLPPPPSSKDKISSVVNPTCCAFWIILIYIMVVISFVPNLTFILFRKTEKARKTTEKQRYTALDGKSEYLLHFNLVCNWELVGLTKSANEDSWQILMCFLAIKGHQWNVLLYTCNNVVLSALQIKKGELGDFFFEVLHVPLKNVYVLVQFFFCCKFFLNQFKIFKLVLFFYISVIFSNTSLFLFYSGGVYSM